MNRASQAQIVHETNIGLLSIRQLELNYYTNLNIAVGYQAAMIGGFTYNIFTQNQPNDKIAYAQIFQNIYWIVSAGAIAASVHVIITTMIIQVLGPGLALHGPVGSMARATKGMRIEQTGVIVSFIVMVILFALSTVISFWAVMGFYSSIGATAMFIIAARCWFYYGERIYLRFYWENDEIYEDFEHDQTHMHHNHEDDLDPSEPLLPPHLRGKKPEDLVKTFEEKYGKGDYGKDGKHHHRHSQDGYKRTVSQSSHDSRRSRVSATKGSKGRRLFSLARFSLLGKKKNKEEKDKQSKPSTSGKRSISTVSKTVGGTNSSGRNPMISSLGDEPVLQRVPSFSPAVGTGYTTNTVVPPIVTSNKRIAMEGFMLKKYHSKGFGVFGFSSHGTTEGSVEWKRRYFVLHNNGHFYLYTDRQAFREAPQKPLYRRPVVLEDFIVDVLNSEQQEKLEREAEEEAQAVRNGSEGYTYGRSLSTASASVISGSTNLSKNSGKAIKDKHHHHTAKTEKHIFQITLIPKENFDNSGVRGSDLDSFVNANVETNRDSHGSSNSSSAGGIGKREPLVLRVDTEEELSMWVISINDVSPTSFL